jgi:hypothetical protein
MHEWLSGVGERGRNLIKYGFNRGAEARDRADQHDGDEGQQDGVLGRRRTAIVFKKLH